MTVHGLYFFNELKTPQDTCLTLWLKYLHEASCWIIVLYQTHYFHDFPWPPLTIRDIPWLENRILITMTFLVSYMQPTSSSSLGRSRRLEVTGADKNEARAFFLAPIYFQAPATQDTPALPVGRSVAWQNKERFSRIFCKCTKPAQRQLPLRTTSKRPVGIVFNYKTTYHTLSSSASSSPVRSSSSLSLSSGGSSTATQNEYLKIHNWGIHCTPMCHMMASDMQQWTMCSIQRKW